MDKITWGKFAHYHYDDQDLAAVQRGFRRDETVDPQRETTDRLFAPPLHLFGRDIFHMGGNRPP